MRGTNHGLEFQYSCLLPTIVRDVVDFCNGGTDAMYRLPWAPDVVPPELATPTQAGLGYVELTAPGVDKGTGLAIVAADLGIGPRDVVVFGDMPNDLPMFDWATGRCVAVANAHHEVIARADELTASNNDDGVAKWLEGLLN